ncbi:MAG: hypothetical protein A2074_06920 [Candidatus Aquicultor primus]|uniref:DUF5668 domain-containing protein n=1 Tax=Candidatus Aquicultor primus TaxID=1797195 RepID=A0A1F2UKR5_9ACTN|nr:MAG: hypothetical protein A2074_06920 [Candidatus Aquicultor primus]
MAEEEGKQEQRAEEKAGREHPRFKEEHKTARGGLIFGLILISVGAILLVDNFYPGLGFTRLWPVIIIAWGFAVLVSGLIPPLDFSKPLDGILIGTIGLILLYNTLGIVPYRFWLELIALWPVLIIALGFSILGGVTRNRIIAALPTLIIIATLLFALFYMDGPLRPRIELTSVNKSRAAISGVKTGEAKIDFSVGELDIGSTGMLYDLNAREFGDERGPQIDFSRSGDKVELNVKARDDIRFYRWDEQRVWNLALSKDIDWRLRVDAGVSDSDLDLSELDVSSVDIDGGVGSIRVRFGDRNKKVDAKIDTGVSECRIMVPKTSGVRLTLDRGLSAVDFKDIGLDKVSENGLTVYETKGFANASKKVDLDVDMGVASFIVEGY